MVNSNKIRNNQNGASMVDTYMSCARSYRHIMLGIDDRTTSRNERSNENAKKAPAEENRTRNIDTGMKEK